MRLAAVAAAALAACSPAAAPSAPAPQATALGVPQSGLEMVPLTIRSASGTHRFTVEIARTDEQQQHGMMFRTSLAPDRGMLFPYDPPQSVGFWMKNTLIPLDIAHFDGDGRLLNVCRMKPADDPAVGGADLKAPSIKPARFVLEVNYGWFDARGLIDAEGKPTKPVLLEAPDAVRRLADQAE